MFCEKCGFENNEAVRFCIECGAVLEKNDGPGSSFGYPSDIKAMESDNAGMEKNEAWGYTFSSPSDIKSVESDNAGMEVLSDINANNADRAGFEGGKDSCKKEAELVGTGSSSPAFIKDSYARDADYRGMQSRRHHYLPSLSRSCLPSGNDPAMLPMAKGGWNWGAFMFGWIWLLSHNMIPWGLVVMFLSFFSGLGIFANIYLGVKGNELAWIYRPFRSFQHFEETQKAWGFWGGLVFGISMGAWALIFLLVIFSNF